MTDRLSLVAYVRGLERAQSTAEGQARIRDLEAREQAARDRTLADHARQELATFPARAREVAEIVRARKGNPSATLQWLTATMAGPRWKEGEGAIISGTKGLGKTVALCAAGLLVASAGGTCLYVAAYDALSYQSDPRVKSVDLLCVDEVHRLGESQEWVVNVVRGWVDARYGARRHTILAGTLGPADLLRILGPETLDRIPIEHCHSASGPSRRWK